MANGGRGGSGTLQVSDASVLIGAGGRLRLGGVAGGGSGALLLGPGTLHFGAGATFVINDNGALRFGGAPGANIEAGSIVGLGTLRNDGSIEFNQRDTALLEATVTGSGRIISTSGIATLTGENTYTGGTTIAGGTLQLGNGGTSGSILGNVTNNGTFAFNRSDALSFAGVISGSGAVNKTGSGTTILTGDSSYTGNTGIYSGALQVDGSIVSSAHVYDGATLSGTGTVGSAMVRSGGTLSPGSTTSGSGTLTVGGDLTFAAGSSYAVGIAGDGASDLTHVMGTASILGGVISVTALDAQSSYQNGQTYKILTSDTAVSGTFDDAVSKSAFLDANETYDAKNVYLTVSTKGADEVLFETVAETKNQMATAKALDTLEQSGPSLGLYNRLLMLSADEARNAFDQLSGEAHASAKAALVESSQFVRNAMNNRLRSASGTTPTLPVMAYGPETKTVPDAFDSFTPAAKPVDHGAWMQGYGSWDRYDGNGNAAGLDYTTGGFVTGVDGMVLDNWRLGFLAGYSRTTFDLNERSSSGQSDNYTLGAYTDTQWAMPQGALALRSGLAYTWSKVEMERLAYFSGFSDSLGSNYNAGTLQAHGELAYRWGDEETFLEPFANLAYVRVHTDSFMESGSTAAALSVGSDTLDTAFTTLGVRASKAFTLGGLMASAQGSIGWRHAYGDLATSSTNSFVGSSAFAVDGVPITKDAATIEAGLNFMVSSDATLGISYTGQFGNDAYENGFDAKFRVRF
ncbi:autotransporter domain-containing protein [Neorhizobium sp. T786]|nr:autotransporter domain-containing protein [Neorhizobium xiangyangii]